MKVTVLLNSSGNSFVNSSGNGFVNSLEKGLMNSIVINGVKDFFPAHIFDCGQAFRWNSDGDGYVGIVKDKVIRVIYNEDTIILENCTYEDYERVWRHYLDLDRDYTELKQTLSEDPILKEAIGYGWGLRILNQDPWETLTSFILSANNNIVRIKKIIERLSAKFGTSIIWEGREYFTFPKPEILANADDDALKSCGCGYRGSYIRTTARMVLEGIISLEQLKNCSYEEAHRVLLNCMGVGDKVADCILLFALEKSEAFPVDVWVKRIMEYYYISQPVPIKQIRSVAADKFGKHAGLAQQYLFYYAREQKIGK